MSGSTRVAGRHSSPVPGRATTGPGRANCAPRFGVSGTHLASVVDLGVEPVEFGDCLVDVVGIEERYQLNPLQVCIELFHEDQFVLAEIAETVEYPSSDIAIAPNGDDLEVVPGPEASRAT